MTTPHFEADEFESWREHPITRHVLDVWMAARCADAQAASASAAWAGNLDSVHHACLREAHDRMQELRMLSYDDLIEDDDDQKNENRPIPAR
jgi:hypothetical protein